MVAVAALSCASRHSVIGRVENLVPQIRSVPSFGAVPVYVELVLADVMLTTLDDTVVVGVAVVDVAARRSLQLHLPQHNELAIERLLVRG